jgi:hypothetical protein
VTVAATAPPSATPCTWAVTAITAVGNGLYRVDVVGDDQVQHRVYISLNDLSLRSVILSVEAVGILAATSIGATPVMGGL